MKFFKFFLSYHCQMEYVGNCEDYWGFDDFLLLCKDVNSFTRSNPGVLH